MPRFQTLPASFALFVLLGCSACATTADGVAGRWRGSFDIPTREGTRHDTAYLILRESRGRVRGSAGPNEEMQKPISRGVIRDGVLTFLVKVRPGMVVDFALEDEGNRLTGIATGLPPNTAARAVVDVARVRAQAATPGTTAPDRPSPGQWSWGLR